MIYLKVDRFHMEQYAYLSRTNGRVSKRPMARRFWTTRYSPMVPVLGDGSTHQYNDLPIIVGGGGKRINGGQHINLPEGTPLANLWLTQAKLMGVESERFADSTGEVGALLA